MLKIRYIFFPEIYRSQASDFAESHAQRCRDGKVHLSEKTREGSSQVACAFHLGRIGVRMSRRGKEALPRGRVERGELKAATNEYDFRFEWYNKGPRARGHYLLNNITGPGRATWPT